MRIHLRESVLITAMMDIHKGSMGLRSLAPLALLSVVLATAAAGCNQGLGAFSLGVGNTPNRPPGIAFRVLGQVGLPFSAIIYNSDATWLIRGSIPMSIVLINGNGPVRVIATKQSAGNGILSMQLTVGFVVRQISSTTDPFGVASLQSTATQPGFSPPPPMADPDVRIFVKGPLVERFNGLIEDQNTGFSISERAPTMFLFDSPQGKVDATFNQVQNLGPFAVDLLLNGAVVDSASGGPSVTVREP